METTLAPTANNVIRIFRHQQELLHAPEFIAALVGGRGCGKSFTLGLICAAHMQVESPLVPAMLTANTHDQLNRSTVRNFREILYMNGIEHVQGVTPPKHWDVPYRSINREWNNVLTTITGHVFLLYSLEEPDNLRGNEVGLLCVDEAGFVDDRYAFDECAMPCLRSKFAKRLIARLATSPGDLNWCWEDFAEESPVRKPGYRLIRATSYDNTELPEMTRAFLENKEGDSYDREVLGLWVPRGSNRCYTEFDPSGHVSDRFDFDPKFPIYLGCDFNRSPLAWEMVQIVGDNMFVFDELFIEVEATTLRACVAVRDRYPKSKIYAYPDYSAGNRSTREVLGIESDIDIMEKEGIGIIAPFKKNPAQADRIEAVQKRLRERKLIVHSRCSKLRHSLLSTMYKPNTREIAKAKKPKVIAEHPSDALGYLVIGHDHYPGISTFDVY